MKKWLAGVLVAAAALAIVAAGAVTAAVVTRAETRAAAPGAWAGLRMGMIRPLVFGALAEGLGISGEELEERLQSGEDLAEIAEAEGFSEEELDTLLGGANEQARQNAVDEGLLTQERADWVAAHMPLSRGMRGWLMMGELRFPVRRGWMGEWMAPGRHPMWP